jgi:hypothetical protein
MNEQDPGAGGGKFDPTRHMRQLRGRGGNSDYLDVKWRLVWLRSEHPDAQINTEHVTITADLAIFRAQVTIPGGGSATGYGSETARDFGDFIEKAETKALGRALLALGFGTQSAQELGEDEVTETVPARPAPSRLEPPAARSAPAPAPQPATPQRPTPPPTPPRAEVIPADSRRPAPVRPLREMDEDGLDGALAQMAEERPAPARIRAAAPAPEPEPEPAPEAEPVARAIPRPAPQPVVRPAPRPTPVVTREPDPDALEEEAVDMANYGWTEFWSWARARGYSDRKSLDAVVGRPTSGMTPMEIRKSIQAKEM